MKRPNCRWYFQLAGSCWLLVVGEASAALTRGPYIQMGHFTNRVTIVWRTDNFSDSAVDYGLTPAYGMTLTGPAGYQHEVQLTGLQPGTTYYYRVRSGGAVLAAATFRSGKGPGTPFRLGLFSDTHYAGAGPIGVLLHAAQPDLLLACGDITDDGYDAELDANIFSPLGAVLASCPLYWSPGNHDLRDGFAACRQAFVLPDDEMNYSFEYADALIVSLNSENLPGTNWLAATLAASAKPWKIVFFHRAAYSAAGGHGEYAPIRDAYVPIMERAGVQLVAVGHNHYYWRSAPLGGITHLMPGRAGTRSRETGTAPCYTQWARHGTEVQSFALADIDGDTLRLQAFDGAGNLFDENVIDRASPFVMDGQLDSAAVLIASRSGGQTLWAAQSNGYLYVATPDAGEGYDGFLFVASAPAALTNPAPWGKTGTVVAYDAFFADENDNNYSRAYAEDGRKADPKLARSATPWCNGGVLEGVIRLAEYYNGVVPDSVYLAAALYGNGNGGALLPASQCPAGNGNLHLEASELVAYPLQRPVPNGIRITQPPVATLRVDSAIAQFHLQGTAGTNLTGPLAWTNSATGQSGLFEHTAHWSRQIDLHPGINDIRVFGILSGAAAGALTLAVDRADAYSVWTNGSDRGFGWNGGWQLSVSGATAGHFLDTGSANNSASPPAFGLWANSDATARARRALAEPLQPGDTLSLLFDNNWIQTGGAAGFTFENAAGEPLLNFYFFGGTTNYNLQDAAAEIRDSGIPWTGGGLSVRFTLHPPPHYSLAVNSTVQTGTLLAAASGHAVRQIQIWNHNCGPGTERNVYFNHLEHCRPLPPPEGAILSAEVRIIRAPGAESVPVIRGLSGGPPRKIRLEHSVAGARYALYWSPTLSPAPNWQEVPGSVHWAAGGLLELLLTNGLPADGFYRVGFLPP